MRQPALLGEMPEIGNALVVYYREGAGGTVLFVPKWIDPIFHERIGIKPDSIFSLTQYEALPDIVGAVPVYFEMDGGAEPIYSPNAPWADPIGSRSWATLAIDGEVVAKGAGIHWDNREES